MSRPRPYDELREPLAIVAKVPRRRAPRWTRPLGYAAATIVWLALLVATGAITLLALPLALADAMDGGTLLDLPLFARSDAAASVVVIAVVVAPLLGVVTLLLGATTTSMTLSAATLLVRSLRPRYADERLSLSLWTRGETVGPASTAVTGTTMSLLPIRMTRWTKIVTVVRFNGWILNANLLILGCLWGVGYVWTVGWLLWPAEGVARALCAGGSIAIGVVLLGVGWRRRRRYPEVMPAAWAGSPYARSWPNRRD